MYSCHFDTPILSGVDVLDRRSAQVDNFKAVMFPSYDPHKDARGVKRREMSDHADCCSEVAESGRRPSGAAS